MRDIDSASLAALAARALVARDFIQITGISFEDGSSQTAYFWSDYGTVTAEVIDAITGVATSHEYIGTATLLKIDDIPLTSDVTVRTVNATLSQINQAVVDAVRGYDLKQAPVQIHRGLFDPATRELVAAPLPRFVGFVDTSIITTPQEGNDGSIVLTLTSHTQELTRFNTAKCSDADQQRRSSGDTFYQDMAVVGNWQIFWGQAKGSQAST
jgi:hypothetical protein